MDGTTNSQLPSELQLELSRLENRTRQIKDAIATQSDAPLVGSMVDVLYCEAGGVGIGIEAAMVEKVSMMAAVSPVPGDDASLVGVLNYQGRPVPLIDLAVRIWGAPTSIDDFCFVVICHTEERIVALLVEQADGVRTVECQWFPIMDPALPIADFVTAISTDDTGKALYVLGVDRIVRGLGSDLGAK